MALDQNIQKLVSVFVKSQFPDIYRNRGPVFVSFVEAYFEWMESAQGLPIYDSRRILDYQDIDTTVSAFIKHFKTTYLPSIQFGTKTDIQQLVKHSLDLYRSRGTPRAVDLLFRLVFGVGATVYFPGSDLFKLSDGQWIRPIYLEVPPTDFNQEFVGQDIFGLNSGAIGFVERVVRRQAPSGLLIDTMYLSPLTGNFQTGELVQSVNTPVAIGLCPVIVGSLTDLNIVEGGTNFDIGDSVVCTGAINGYDAVARIANTSGLGGIVQFDLIDGGYGYTANSLVLVSANVLTLDRVVVGANTDGDSYFQLFDQLTQPQAFLNYLNLIGSAFANNDQLSTYYPNGSVHGTGTVLSVTISNSTAGVLYVGNISGNLSINAIYNQANGSSANLNVVNGYFDATASANVISDGQFLTTTLNINGLTGRFLIGETITQPGTSYQATVVLFTSGSGSSGTIEKQDVVGVINNSIQVVGSTSGATASVVSQSFEIGIITVNNEFTTDPRAPVIGTNSNTRAIITGISTGTGATFSVGTLEFPETVTLSNDYILPYASTRLNSTGYGFPAFATANTNTTLVTALSFANVTVGKIATITGINPGEDYTAAPLSRVFEPLVYPYLQQNELLTILPNSGSFTSGELITQSSTSARGMILSSPSSNSTTIYLQRLNVFANFVPTTNSTTQIVGTTSGAVANVLTNVAEPYHGPTDISGQFIGVDAVIAGNVSTAPGAVTDLQVIDSGFGFQEGEFVTFVRSDGNFGTAQAILEMQGEGNGYYAQVGGFLSDRKRLFDGHYWQNFSYEVRSSLGLEQYADILRSLLHVAGTAAFGAVYKSVVANVALGISSESSVTQVSNLNRPLPGSYLPILIPA